MGNMSLPEIVVPGKSAAAINNQRRRLKEAGQLNSIFVGRTLKPWTIRELTSPEDKAALARVVGGSCAPMAPSTHCTAMCVDDPEA